jgi:dihydropteroate synthase
MSIDTTRVEVARAALDLGASVVNDISCATEPELLALVAERGASYVLMHNRGRGEVTPPNTRYEDVCADVVRELTVGLGRAQAAGIARSKIWIDPGIGFAKTAQQSVALLKGIEAVVALGSPVLLGASRKGLLAEIAPRADGSLPGPLEREAAGAAVVALLAQRGVAGVRVHDVAAARQALLVSDAVGGRAC